MSDNVFGTGEPGQDAFPPVSELTYEQARAELIETVKILELGQMGLDESLTYWERGEALAKACEAHLDGAARRVESALAASASAPDAESDGSDVNGKDA
ncbi:exodeoxyribonuclease VII small subunit [uncultured Corynebacterium sp.]|uniref:exodeoxyribonuclease VII small subunit n=1 Tax=uncultured Corynebacterium sp. TaxID=159447 RepID=UPI0025F8F422|nr:exodeoxyribonuclease VII small subunit [uncultured Corynebacterium sp.]